MYDQPINLKGLLLLIVMMVISIHVSAQNELSDPNQDLQLLSKAILDPALWDETSFEMEDLSKIYLLDHGVTLNIPDTLNVQGIKVEIIQKNQLSQIGNVPLIQVHTFNVSNNDALIRLYLRYVENGIEKSTNAEQWFIKDGTNWNLVTK